MQQLPDDKISINTNEKGCDEGGDEEEAVTAVNIITRNNNNNQYQLAKCV